MRDMDHHGMIGQFKKGLFFYVAMIIKYDQTHFPSYHDESFIFIPVKMPVRLNI